jgi:L-alanine-DL-glutamate epimerase-like enolase superfamily enzyme
MKITQMSVTLFSWQAAPTTQLPGAGEHRRAGDLGYLRIETDDGAVGESFLGSLDNPASADASRAVDVLKPVLIGRGPFDREYLHSRMSQLVRYSGYRCLGSVDVALWDLAGKVAGLPIHALLGTARTAIPVYVSSQRFSDVVGYVSQAGRMAADGWRGYKIHPPKSPPLDIKIAEAVRDACPPDFALMLDGGWRYDYLAALQVGKALEACGYTWFEDPFGEFDLYNSAKLRAKLSIPLLATEQPAAGLASYAAWISQHATDMLRGDVPTKGGITNMIKGAHLAEAFGMGYEIHYSGNALCDLANAHVAMAISNCRFLETLYPDPIHRVGASSGMDIDGSGIAHAPTGPGLGAVVDTEYIKAHKIAVLT